MIKYLLLLFGCAYCIACSDPSRIKLPMPPAEPLQELPFVNVSLETGRNFKKMDTLHWRIIGNALLNRAHNRLDIVRGLGLLTGHWKDSIPVPLMAVLEHGDLDLRFDFMLSPGADAVLLLQGRYAIRLANDSNHINAAVCGSVYNGAAWQTPVLNAGKAPGLWQHMILRFKAPVFDSTGKKITDARVEKIVLNGQEILQDVTVKSPSPLAIAKNEQPKASLAFSGTAGTIVLRSIRYKAYNGNRVKFDALQYAVYKGVYKSYTATADSTPVKKGATDTVSWRLGSKGTQLVVTGNMQLPVGGDYFFKVRGNGNTWLLIDGQEVVNNGGTATPRYTTRTLTAGTHPFQLVYANTGEGLVVEYEGPGIPLTPLTTQVAEKKLRPIATVTSLVKDTVVLRQDGTINTGIISVGMPGNLNYMFDLHTNSLLYLWRGPFASVPVKEQDAPKVIPMGVVVALQNRPPVMQLNTEDDNWPDSIPAARAIYANSSYYHTKSGLPVFVYQYNYLQVEDQLEPAADHTGFNRRITLKAARDVANTYYLLGSGTFVEKLPGSIYAIDDKEYFIENLQGIALLKITATPNGTFELLYPISLKAGQEVSFTYLLRW